MDDKDCWQFVEPRDLWVTDKLILARQLGYQCGPAGVLPAVAAQYIVRPCVNYRMMSRGASIQTLNTSDDVIPDGYFWCELFTGRHLSFDYSYGKQILSVEGFRNDPLRLDRFSMWKRTADQFELPPLLQEIANRYEQFNIEVIGTSIIEVHFRHNDDFANHTCDTIVPVWADEFYSSPCGDRVGFILKSK